MAFVYRLQVGKAIVEKLKSGDESVPTELMLFESSEEKKEFLNDSEAFLRKNGALGQNDPFNGLECPENKSIDDLIKNPIRLLYCYHRIPCKWYCHG